MVARSSLPVAWDVIPAGDASIQYGSKWLAKMTSPILVLPSVIIYEEKIALINPRHPLAAKITATAIRRFDYTGLFR